MTHGLHEVLSFLMEHVYSTLLQNSLQNWYSHAQFVENIKKKQIGLFCDNRIAL